MSAALVPPSATVPVRRTPPYKDFLQPALHRRFSSTALVLLGISYAESLFLSSWPAWLWVWFPLSGAGLRAITIFFCGLIIIILRIAQYHIGIRTSKSPFETFAYNVFQQKTLETLFSYGLAGWVYGQAYRWSASENANLGWITHFSGDRTRLNERALFLVVHMVFVGLTNATLHLFWDSDRLVLGSAKPGKKSPGAGRTSQLYKELASSFHIYAIASLTRALASVFVSVPIYTLFLRPTAWRATLVFFRPFYSLPRSSLPPMAKPFASSWDFLPRCFLAGYLFSLLLVVSNAAFSIFLVHEPLKDGKPLTSDSLDPNGSLLNGLKSKKANIKAFAMWELAFVARDFPDRREAIYTDIDRKDGPAWSQICKICLDTIKALESRIDPPKLPTETFKSTFVDDDMPKRLTRPLKGDQIVAVTPQKKTFQSEVEKMVSKVVVDPRQPPRLSPIAKRAIEDAKKKLIEVQQDVSGPENPDSSVQLLVRTFLALPIVGWPFRSQFQDCITAAVLGEPYGEQSFYVNAINALVLLSVHSLSEDKFGNVHRDVAKIIRQLTVVTKKLESFKAKFPTHWTDVESERTCPEVDGILDTLKDGLSDLLKEFGPYSRDLRLTTADLRLAEDAANAGRSQEEPEGEMVEVR